jgi:RHS repeat-associated protein
MKNIVSLSWLLNDEGMFVNGLFSGARTSTDNFTAYINPYLVVSRGGNYTKHIYIGSQRIVSKLGDLDSYGQDPRRIAYAGSEVDGANVDFAGKYREAQETLKDRYSDFEVPYNGTDNDDYVNGGSFCCDDSPQLRAGTNDNPELYQYYYHSDHLGSTSLITNLDGEIVQHVEYVPFGEVFIEERNNTWNTPYLFNAKELDEETGLYYYGVRYYDSRVIVWLGVDPMWEKSPGISVYAYCLNNPVRFIDPDGRQVIGVHGTWSDKDTWKNKGSILNATYRAFVDNKHSDFNFEWSGGNYASMRTAAAKELIGYIQEARIKNNISKDEPITLVGHSHGGNVSIEAINMMVNMEEFQGITINLLTINTPVRSDYQLSEKAQSLVNHINVYDEKDPIQSKGGAGLIVLPENKSAVRGTGEYGKAGRTFKNATNIKVDNPQGIFKDYHNSHNRVDDWFQKLPENQ